MKLFRRGGEARETNWAVHEQRAGELVSEAPSDTTPAHLSWSDLNASGQAWADRVFSSQPEVAGSALMLLVREAAIGTMPWLVTMSVNNLLRRKWTVSRADAFLAIRVATKGSDDWQSGWAFKAAEVMLRRAVADSPLGAEEMDAVRAAITSLESRRNLPPADRREVRSRLVLMLPDSNAGTVDTSAIVPVDGWSATVLPELATASQPDQVSGLLRHLASASSASQPTQKWLTRTGELLADGQLVRVVQVLIDSLVTAEPLAKHPRYGGGIPLVVDEQNTDIARAAVWAAILIERDWVVSSMHALAVRGIEQTGFIGWFSGDKVPNAAILVLGRNGTPEAVGALQQINASTKHNGFRKRVATALAVAAEAAGLTPSQLAERNVSTGGLDETAAVTFNAGALVARASVDERLKVTTEWRTKAGWAAKPAAEAVTADVNRIKRAVKELRDLIRVERLRVESLLASGRTWNFDEWRRYYIDHPITGQLSRRLLWTFDAGSTSLTGLPLGADTMITIDGEASIPPDATIRLWHPATASTDEVSSWRQWLLREQFVQPFKQAFREVYLLTPAELETRVYSNRFAAHVLHYQQLYALIKERLWVSNYLGPYDGGYEGRARHEFPDAGLTAMFEHSQLDTEAGGYRTDLCSTDRVWFFLTNDRGKTAVPLAEIPALVFSEAMRDVDLFVGVTSIALDPNWADYGDDPYYGYWLSASFGALTATAEVRRDVLAMLLPKLKIADRVELGDRYVRVRGKQATYKVHLGSANVLVEPDDRYLCIVPSSSGRTKRVMLPFEGDEVLTVVLSKVLMLAADDKITDPTIRHQIARRP